jgi:uncharacterized protein YbjQ (UPF0145 family)
VIVATTDNVTGHRIVRMTGLCLGVFVHSRGLSMPMMGPGGATIGNTMRGIVACETAAIIEFAP